MEGDPTHPGSLVGAAYSGVCLPRDMNTELRHRQRTALAAAVSGRHREHTFSSDAIFSTANTPLPSCAPSPSGASDDAEGFVNQLSSLLLPVEARPTHLPSVSLLSATRPPVARPSPLGGPPGMARISSNPLLSDFLRSRNRDLLHSRNRRSSIVPDSGTTTVGIPEGPLNCFKFVIELIQEHFGGLNGTLQHDDDFVRSLYFMCKHKRRVLRPCTVVWSPYTQQLSILV